MSLLSAAIHNNRSYLYPRLFSRSISLLRFISYSPFITRWASVNIFFSPIPMQIIPALSAASTPANASSKTTHLPVSTPIISAALRKTSGSGLVLWTEFPSATASKTLFNPTLSRIIGVFLLADPSAILIFLLFSSVNEFKCSGQNLARCHFADILNIPFIL